MLTFRGQACCRIISHSSIFYQSFLGFCIHDEIFPLLIFCSNISFTWQEIKSFLFHFFFSGMCLKVNYINLWLITFITCLNLLHCFVMERCIIFENTNNLCIKETHKAWNRRRMMCKGILHTCIQSYVKIHTCNSIGKETNAVACQSTFKIM